MVMTPKPFKNDGIDYNTIYVNEFVQIENESVVEY